MLVSHSQRRLRVASLQLPGKVWIGSAPVEPVRRLATGIPFVDALCGGGVPRGHLSEIVGAPSSGRTALVAALLAASTRRGEVTAVVDLPDALHPATLWAASADLDRVLWVRPPSLRAGFKCTELILTAGGFGLVVLDLDVLGTSALPLHVWPRLQRGAKRAGTALVLLAPHRVAGSFAAMSIALTVRRPRWNRGLFEGLVPRAQFVRNKVGVQQSAFGGQAFERNEER